MSPQSKLKLVRESESNTTPETDDKKMGCIRMARKLGGALFAENQVDAIAFVLEHTGVQAEDLIEEDLYIIRQHACTLLNEEPENEELQRAIQAGDKEIVNYTRKRLKNR